LLKDGPEAADRIAQAVRGGETILVHGDYDVDGICAAALLTRWLRRLGASVEAFVPHRVRDGYDFSAAGLLVARDAGATLIVTADCGTVAHETIRQARAAGIDVVVTDHHTVAGDLPDAVAVVNPQRADCTYPDKSLCGAGLAFKLCQLTGDALDADGAELLELLDLVALATVADLVPLSGENRVLVSYGLRRFERTRVRGLAALLEVSGVPQDEVTAGKLGFVVAPRINAAGRIAEAADALQLLLTEDADEARTMAARLDLTNKERQEEDRRTQEEAFEQLAESFDPEKDFGVVLASEGWHPGVIGIVASRVVERIHRPVVMVALTGDRGRGSARSIPGFHLYDALSSCAHHLSRFGGHRQAAGMDLERDSLPAFREAFNTEARSRLENEELRPTLRPDMTLSPSDVDLALVHWLSYLGPHGIGNPGPLFSCGGVFIDRPRLVGESHLKAVLKSGGVSGGAGLDAIGFGFAERFPPGDIPPVPHDVLFRLERNEWRGVAKPQARLIDMRRSLPVP
jgi:single-stranded-DNA-specific exonuclease